MPFLEFAYRDLLEERVRGLADRGKIGNRHNSIRLTIRKRLQKHRVHNAEYSRIGADAKRHDENGKRRKARALAHSPPRVQEIP